MKINKDLADATMMLTFISDVLVGTSEFENESLKYIIMGILSFILISAGVLRFLASTQKTEPK